MVAQNMHQCMASMYWGKNVMCRGLSIDVNIHYFLLDKYDRPFVNLASF